MKRGIKIILIALMILVLIGIITVAVLFMQYNSNLKSVNYGKTKGRIIEVEIPTGYGISGIASLLEEKGVIRDAFSMKIYAKLNNIIVDIFDSLLYNYNVKFKTKTNRR